MRVAVLYTLFTAVLCLLASLLTTLCQASATSIPTTCLGRPEDAAKYDPASRAHLSPVVFAGRLGTVYEGRAGTRIRATFEVLQRFRPMGRRRSTLSEPPSRDHEEEMVEEVEVEYLQPPPEDGEVSANIRHTHRECTVRVDEESLQPGREYIVFAAHPPPLHRKSSSTSRRPQVDYVAVAEPVRNTGRNRREVKRVLCNGCAIPPGVRGLKDTKVQEKKRLRLQCQLSGNPPPTVEWYKNGEKVNGTKGRVRIKTKKKYSRLIIKRTRLYDNGEYECRASNVVSKEHASMKALVIVAKTPPRTRRPPPKPTKATSPWPVDGIPCPKPDFCLNGGRCIFYKELEEYVCHCAEGYVGLRCDFKDVSLALGDIKHLEREHQYIFASVVIVGVLFFLIILGTVSYRMYRKLHESQANAPERTCSASVLKKLRASSVLGCLDLKRKQKPPYVRGGHTQSDRGDTDVRGDDDEERVADGTSDSEELPEPPNAANDYQARSYAVARPRLYAVSSVSCCEDTVEPVSSFGTGRRHR